MLRVLLGSMLSLWLGLAPDALAQEAPPAEAPAPAAEEEASATEVPAAAEAAPEAEPEVRAVTATSVTPPKVAVVLVGDPDERALEAAEALLAQLEASADVVRLPTDVALRRAMLGRGADDGLDGVRSERRALGLSERRDIPALVRLGRLATAVAVVVVRATGTGHEATVLDVNRAAFFDGALSLPAGDADVAPFIGRRARSAVRAVDAPASDVAEAAELPEAEEAEPASGVTPVVAEIPAEEAPAGDPVLQWFEQNWAYLAAGALLAGGVVFVVVVATDPGPPQPMLRFVPGE